MRHGNALLGKSSMIRFGPHREIPDQSAIARYTAALWGDKYGGEWIVPWPNAGHGHGIGYRESVSSPRGSASPIGLKKLRKDKPLTCAPHLAALQQNPWCSAHLHVYSVIDSGVTG
jgi:hypothetical protein